MTLGFQQPWFLSAPIITQDMNIITDNNCNGKTNPDMALGGNSAIGITMAPVAMQVTQISMAPLAVWPSDTNIVLDGCSDSRLWHSPWW